jgi:hypothetical protein
VDDGSATVRNESGGGGQKTGYFLYFMLYLTGTLDVHYQFTTKRTRGSQINVCIWSTRLKPALPPTIQHTNFIPGYLPHALPHIDDDTLQLAVLRLPSRLYPRFNGRAGGDWGVPSFRRIFFKSREATQSTERDKEA